MRWPGGSTSKLLGAALWSRSVVVDLRRIVHADLVLDLRRDLVLTDGGTDGVVGQREGLLHPALDVVVLQRHVPHIVHPDRLRGVRVTVVVAERDVRGPPDPAAVTRAAEWPLDDQALVVDPLASVAVDEHAMHVAGVRGA